MRTSSAPQRETLPGLFGPQVQPRPHKRLRQVQRDQINVLREQQKAAAKAGRETAVAECLRHLSHFINRTNRSPTSSELWSFAHEHGGRWRHVGDMRPRLHDLLKLSVIAPSGKRRCAVTGVVCTTWSVREAGSQEPRA